MPLEQALEELKKYAQELTKIEETNKDEFIHQWAKVNQYYKYIIKNAPSMSDEWFTAIDIISDIASENPNLEKWVEMIVDPKQNKTQAQVQNANVDPTAISNSIEALTTEIKNMQFWDQNHIEDIKRQLNEYQKTLMANESLFETNVYQSLMNEINESLDKINKFMNMINSDEMENMKRM